MVAIAVLFALLVAALIAVARKPAAPSAVEAAPPVIEDRPSVGEMHVEAAGPIEGVAPIAGPAPRAAPLPVVLVHGLFGFDRIGVPGARFDYFRGIAVHLNQLGCATHAVRLPMSASVPSRAKQLVAAIDALPHERMDIIAHSLGGLDARFALAQLGLADRVRSLVTIGTPHRGSPIADLFHEGSLDWARRLVTALGISIEAVEWLSSAGLAKFNADVTDVPGVRYGSVVGGIKDESRVPVLLAPGHAWLTKVAGPNDGVVPVASQSWGEVLAEIDADHFAQIGWRIGGATFDAQGLYAFLVARLGDVPQTSTPPPSTISA
ncbi:MAG TPA: alpha/beta fold hydrolase [Kofleriaceae bacterium]|jgi:triacylglycerol lipase